MYADDQDSDSHSSGQAHVSEVFNEAAASVRRSRERRSRRSGSSAL